MRQTQTGEMTLDHSQPAVLRWTFARCPLSSNASQELALLHCEHTLPTTE